jgi:hypothetical protein
LGFGVAGFLLLAGSYLAWRSAGALGGSIGEALPWFTAAAALLGTGAIIELHRWSQSILSLAGKSVFVVDHFSGEVEFCTSSRCDVLPRQGV